jgi:rubrerythrin
MYDQIRAQVAKEVAMMRAVEALDKAGFTAKLLTYRKASDPVHFGPEPGQGPGFIQCNKCDEWFWDLTMTHVCPHCGEPHDLA